MNVRTWCSATNTLLRFCVFVLCCSWTCLLSPPALDAQVLTLTPSLSFIERYDDNIFQTDSDTEDDFIAAIAPGLSLRYAPTANTSLDLDYGIGIERFAKHPEQDQVTHHGMLQVASLLSRRISLKGSEALVITEDQEERTLAIDEVTGLRPVSDQARRRTIRNSANGLLAVRVAPRTSIELLADSLLVDVDVPSELDEFRYTFGTNVSYLTHVARDSRVSVGYDITFHTFRDNGPVPQAQQVESADFQVQTLHAGFRHAFSSKLSGNVTVGYAKTTFDDPELDGDQGFVADVGINRRLRTGLAALGYHRQFTSGGGEGGSVVADIFTLSVSTRITPKITASLGANLSFFDFRQNQSDRLFWTVRPALTYQIFRFWALAISYDVAFTRFDDPAEADRMDQRLQVVTHVVLRDHLSLDLAYHYASRSFSGGEARLGEGGAFDRDQFFLTLTYAARFFL